MSGSSVERLAGKAVLVTGGASGIGRAIVERFVAGGARVAIADIDAEASEQLASELGPSVVAVPTDVASEPEVEAMIARTVEALGALDVAVNNAYTRTLPPPIEGPVHLRPAVPFFEQDATTWHSEIDHALVDQYVCFKHQAIHMTQQGTGGVVLMVSSILGQRPTWGASAHCAARAGLDWLVPNAAMELGRFGIRVNGIAPGLIRTAANETTVFADERVTELFLRNIPLGRAGRPEDVAGLAAFLAGDEASYITGDIFRVDAGMWAYEQPRIGAPPDMLLPGLFGYEAEGAQT